MTDPELIRISQNFRDLEDMMEEASGLLSQNADLGLRVGVALEKCRDDMVKMQEVIQVMAPGSQAQ